MSRDVVLAISGLPPNLYIRWRDFLRVDSGRVVETEEKKACCSVVVYCRLSARQGLSGQ